MVKASVQQNKWYIITGGPSTGKSTLLSELGKLGHKTVPEVARQVIEESLKAGQTLEQIRHNEEYFQKKVFRIVAEREKILPKDMAIFFDRGLHDAAAYMTYYQHRLDDNFHKILKQTQYNQVFLLEPLPTFHKDHARNESPDFTHKITDQLAKTYTEYGMKPIRVPAIPVANRLQYILDQL